MLNTEAAKLVLAGPVGAGKTTTIRSIADCEPISTEMPMTTGALGQKTTTTVALDFASVVLADGTPLLIYGMPGQDHFSFMRPILVEGAIGVAVVLDGRDPDVVDQCSYWLDSMREIDESIAIVIGITHTETNPSFSLEPIRNAIRGRGTLLPVFTFDARVKTQAEHLVRALLVAAM